MGSPCLVNKLSDIHNTPQGVKGATRIIILSPRSDCKISKRLRKEYIIGKEALRDNRITHLPSDPHKLLPSPQKEMDISPSPY